MIYFGVSVLVGLFIYAFVALLLWATVKFENMELEEEDV